MSAKYLRSETRELTARRSAFRWVLGLCLAGLVCSAGAAVDVANIAQLRSAIQAANVGGDPVINLTGSIDFELNTPPDSGRYQVDVLHGDLDITHTGVTINGNGHTIDAHFRDRIFYIDSMTTTAINVTLQNMTLRNGFCDPSASEALGGAILGFMTNLTLQNVTISGNYTQEDGGGVAILGYYNEIAGVTKSTLTMTSCTLDNNRGANGGAVLSTLTDLTIDGCSIKNNRAETTIGQLGGGGVLATGANCSVSISNHSVLCGNYSSSCGGALSLFSTGTSSITKSLFGGNSASRGGAISLNNAAPTITNCIVSGNYASSAGGGLRTINSSPSVTNCTFYGNTVNVTNSGGAVLGEGVTGSPAFVDTIFDKNSKLAVSGAFSATYCAFAHNPDGDGISGGTGNQYADTKFVMDGVAGTTGTVTAAATFDSATSCTTLTINNVSYGTNFLTGWLIVPDISATNPSPSQGLIISNTATQIVVLGNFSTAGAGKVYKLVNLHLTDGSSAVDRGTNTGAPATDYDGQPRPIEIFGQGNDGGGTIYDIGAYEGQSTGLTVVSAHGSPAPTTGAHVIGSPIDATVAAIDPPGATGTRYVCTGFTGFGSAPSLGLTNLASFVITQDSQITWNWKTQYQLTSVASPPAGGSVNPASGLWYDVNAHPTLQAYPSANYVFDSWSGDLSGSTNPVGLPMDGPKNVTANFIPVPDLTVTKSHTGNFTQGNSGKTYSINVTNSSQGPVVAGNTVTVTDTLPTGLMPAIADNNGWSVSAVGQTITAVRSDALAAGATYPALILTVNVANDAPASITNTVSVSGGGELNTDNNTASDPTTIIQVPDLTITKTHTGDFTQGDVSKTYTITVTNNGPGPVPAMAGINTTVGPVGNPVTVIDTLPAGLTATSLTGPGWAQTSLSPPTATRLEALPAGSSYPPLTLTVNVRGDAPASVTNSVSVSLAGELNTSNNTASDPTNIIQVPDLSITKTHTGDFTQGDTGKTYTVTVSNSGPGPVVAGNTVTVTDTLPTGLTPAVADNNGWTVSAVGQTVTAARNDALPIGGSYPPLTLGVNVANDAPATLTNTATVSGGGELNTSNDSASDPATIIPAPDLTLTKTHTGDFTQGATDKTYTITVTNSGPGPVVAGNTVTVTDTLPAGLTAKSLTGTGWTQTSLAPPTATRSDALGIGADYPALILTVDVAADAAPSITNSVTVSGGGQFNTSNDTANDPTTIIQVPDLTITKLHGGNFTQGQTGRTYAITVTNNGLGPVADGNTVTVTDTLPAGLTARSFTGSGWTQTSLSPPTATRSDTLSSGASYPALILTVDVANDAAASITNTVSVSGGGELNTNNNTASDPTTIIQVPDLTITKTHAGDFTQGDVNTTYTITVTNSGPGPVPGSQVVVNNARPLGNPVTVTDTLPPGLTAKSFTGPGWTQTSLSPPTATRSDGLAIGASYPSIVLTVDVDSAAPEITTNTASVSGGGELNTTNNVAEDPTIIRPPLTATISDVVPVLRNTPVTSMTIAFNQQAAGFDLNTLSLTRDGGANLLTGSETLTGDDYTTWTLDGLTALTGAGGVYELRLVAVNGPTNLSGSPLAEDIITSWTMDATAPTCSVAAVSSSPTNANPIDFTINFSEPVTGLTAGAITVANGTATALAGSGSGPYTVSVTPAGQGLVKCQVPVGAAQDAAGNTNTASNEASVEYDSIAPTSSVAPLPGSTNAASIDFSISFGEPVTGLTAGALTVVNGTATGLTGSGWGPYTLSVTPTNQGDVSCHVPNNVAQDAAGNGNTASNTVHITYDSVKPTCNVSASASSTNVNPIVFTITFSEDVTGLTNGDISTGNGTIASLAGSGAGPYTIGVTPAGQGNVTCQVTADAAQDAAGNGNTVSNQASVLYDSVAPSAPAVLALDPTSDTGISTTDNITNITAPTVIGSGEALASIKLYADGVEVGSGAVNAVGLWSVSISALSEGSHTITAVQTDAVGNVSNASSGMPVLIDTVHPTASVGPVSPSPRYVPVGSVAITFSAPVYGFDLADLSLTLDGVPLSLTGAVLNGSGANWSLDNVTAITQPDGAYELSVNVSNITDAAGNALAASANATWVMDTRTDLVLSKSVYPITAHTTDLVTYTLEIFNAGPTDAENVVLTDPLPSNVELISESVTASNVDGTTRTWNLGKMVAGDMTTITLLARVTEATVITNTADVVYDKDDRAPENNVSSASVAVGPGADLAIAVTADPVPPVLGQPLRYLMTITNLGPEIAENVVVSDTIPAHTVLSGAAVSQGSVDTSGANVVGDLGAIAREATATMTVTVIPQQTGEIDNFAGVTSSIFDRDSTNNTVTTTLSVVQHSGPDLIADSLTASFSKRGPAKLNIRMRVLNRGDVAAGRNSVSYYLSEKNYLDNSAKLIGYVTVNALKPGRSQLLAAPVRIARPAGPVYLITVIDPANKVAEGNELNNVRVFGPLQ